MSHVKNNIIIQQPVRGNGAVFVDKTYNISNVNTFLTSQIMIEIITSTPNCVRTRLKRYTVIFRNVRTCQAKRTSFPK